VAEVVAGQLQNLLGSAPKNGSTRRLTGRGLAYSWLVLHVQDLDNLMGGAGCMSGASVSSVSSSHCSADLSQAAPVKSILSIDDNQYELEVKFYRTRGHPGVGAQPAAAAQAAAATIPPVTGLSSAKMRLQLQLQLRLRLCLQLTR
jgi:hypothetical protein